MTNKYPTIKVRHFSERNHTHFALSTTTTYQLFDLNCLPKCACLLDSVMTIFLQNYIKASVVSRILIQVDSSLLQGAWSSKAITPACFPLSSKSSSSSTAGFYQYELILQPCTHFLCQLAAYLVLLRLFYIKTKFISSIYLAAII